MNDTNTVQCPTHGFREERDETGQLRLRTIWHNGLTVGTVAYAMDGTVMRALRPNPLMMLFMRASGVHTGLDVPSVLETLQSPATQFDPTTKRLIQPMLIGAMTPV